MNVLLVGIAAALAVGGSVGFVAYDSFVTAEPTSRCVDGDPVGESDGLGRIRFRIDNQGPAQDVTVCVHEDGKKVSQAIYTLAARQVEYVELASPAAAVYAEIDLGADGREGMGRSGANLLLCKERTAQVPIVLHAGGGISISGSDCVPRERVEGAGFEQAGLVPADRMDPPMGPAVALGGLFAALTGLAVYARGRLHFLGLLLFSRVAKERVLEHDARMRIQQLVGAEPGIHANAIRERLGLAHGQILYHLHVLSREGVLTRVASFGYRHYFLRGRYPPTQMRAMAALRMPGMDRVYHAVQANPGLDLSRLALQAGLSPARVSRVSRRLESVGLLERRVVGREVLLVPRPSPLAP